MLPSDDMKGRIIGREGRNIRALELATGVDLIVDDTPEAVILSGFDPIRREIARISLERLMQTAASIRRASRSSSRRCGRSSIRRSSRKGRPRFSTRHHRHPPGGAQAPRPPSLPHLVRPERARALQEVAQLAGTMAAELGVNVTIAKRGGLLHDIGKAIDREMEGTHLELGIDMLRKYGETAEIIHAMECHHGDYDPQTVEAVLVNAADALSAARPGARREILETYVKRLEKLEESPPLEGRGEELRHPGRARASHHRRQRKDHRRAVALAVEGRRPQIEQELQYPGQIKVTVIRETRAVEYAR